MKRWQHQRGRLDRVVDATRQMPGGTVVWTLARQWKFHRTGRHVTLIGYFSFVSVFPLLLVFASTTALLSRVLEWDLEQLSASVVGQIPLVGDEVLRQAGSTSGSIVTIVIGALVALWAATKAFMKIFDMNDDVWEVALDERENFARRRARCLLGLVVVGVRALAATAVTTVITVIGLPVVGFVLSAVAALLVNITVLVGLLRLSSYRVPWRVLAPGAITGGVVFWLLQLFGTTLVEWSVGADQGPFTPTFALIAWLTLHAGVITAMAELNASLAANATTDGDAPTH
jgi:uncharacterized BrkB/YihY/UPF0761 family membrane protein